MVIIRKITKVMAMALEREYFLAHPTIHPKSRRLFKGNVVEFIKTSLGFAEHTRTWELKGIAGEWTLCAGRDKNG